MPKISQTSKMKIKGKKVGSWSLPAGSSCPGSKDAEVCKSCYAKKGMYRFPTVKDVREYNKIDYHKDDWVDRMVAKVSKFDYFRWFDSGDIETPELAAKIRLVIHRTKNVKHWLPTRSDKVLNINNILEGGTYDKATESAWVSMSIEFNNTALRFSADNIGLDKPERLGVNSYVIRPADLFEAKRRGIYLCPVTAPGSTQKSCDTCTMCYTDAPVAYMVH
jgi:hypothetical protein